ncbi:hypothetical protein CHS0354_017217 [Potamilus streckersoni]|uniref:EGF-like domain-containing protein n=1 Tax=Potamilus streckersoni TaxID=2493646 RepID=A0AAE0RY94_9BIVA|nr:hypothetical protein CHS0354_017217 [Potamilus streckersoni]
MLISGRCLLLCFIVMICTVDIVLAEPDPALLVTYIPNANMPPHMKKSYCRFPITENGMPLTTARCTTFNVDVSFLSLYADYKSDFLLLYEYIRNSIFLERNHSREDIRTWTSLQTGPSSIYTRIAFDWLSHSLYWTDPAYGWIGVMNTKSGNAQMYRILQHENIQKPHGISLDPIRGFLFWTDIGQTAYIWQSSMSGDEMKVLISSGLVAPYSIVADVRDEKIFWIDDGRDTVESAQYDGTGRKIIRRIAHAILVDIEVFGELVYASDRQNKAVHVMGKNNSGTYQTLHLSDHIPHAIVMYHREAQQMTSTDHCGRLQCSHICVSQKDGAMCMCKERFVLNADGKTCSDSGLLHRGLVVSNSTSICIVDIHAISAGGQRFADCILHTTEITYFELDTNQREIIFANSSGVYYTSVDRFLIKQLFQNSGTISGLGLDWIDQTIYWTEANTGVIAFVSRIKKISFTVLSGLDSPRNILILPFERQMLWVSGRYLHKIESSNLDGSNRKDVIQFSSQSKPASISFDPTNQRLYFVDLIHITSCNLDGSDVKKLYFSPNSIESVYVYKGFLLTLYKLLPESQSFMKSFVFENLNLTEKITTQFRSIGRVMDIKVFDERIQPRIKGPCDVLNGGCEHICIAIGLVNRVCRCRFGYQLDSTNESACSSYPVFSNFLLVSDFTHDMIYQLALETNDIDVQAIDIKHILDPSGIAYDYTRKMVIWGSSKEQKIYTVSLDELSETVLFPTGVQYSVYPDRFAIDFSTGNIYYTAVSVNESANAREGFIGVLSVDGHHKQLVKGFQKLRAIVLHPAKGEMFWTDHGSDPHIGRAEMDGQNSTKFIITGVTWPNGLALDYSADRLYWSDGLTNRIESCKLDGSDRKVIFVDSEAHLMDIAYDSAGSLYYTAWNRPYITKLTLSQPNLTERLFEKAELGRLDALEIYTGDNQPRNALCSNNNGDCSTLCLPSTTGRTCACEDGVTMREDGKTCSNVIPRMESTFQHDPTAEKYTASTESTISHQSITAPKHEDNSNNEEDEKDETNSVLCEEAMSNILCYKFNICCNND